MQHLKKPTVQKIRKAAMITKGVSSSKNDCVCDLVCALLPSVSRLHWFHLNTTSYVDHMVLGELYGCLQEQLDCLAEQYIQTSGALPDYSGHEYFNDANTLIETLKTQVEDCTSEVRGINATIDVIHSALLKALYQLNLK
jgi:hypothetical protein